MSDSDFNIDDELMNFIGVKAKEGKFGNCQTCNRWLKKSDVGGLCSEYKCVKRREYIEGVLNNIQTRFRGKDKLNVFLNGIDGTSHASRMVLAKFVSIYTEDEDKYIQLPSSDNRFENKFEEVMYNRLVAFSKRYQARVAESD